MFTRVIVALVALVVAFAILGADSQAVLHRVPPSVTPPMSGRQMFNSYCSSCHGADGRGSGPAGAALKVAPPDLTRLTARNHGKYPEFRVFGSIQGDPDMPVSHGSKELPVWGDGFQSMSHADGAATRQRVANLAAYIRSLQSLQGK